MTRSRWSWSRTIAATGVGALAVGALASVGAAVSPSGTPAAAKQYPPQKGTLCHHTHSKTHPFVTITVSQRAFPAHLRHGDTIGPCAPATPTAAKAAKTKAKASHGKSGSHGKSVEHGKRESAPGHSATTQAPAVSPAAELKSSRGHSGTAPRPHGTPPGHVSAPVQTESPPAQAPDAPGHGASPAHGGTPPGHGGTPPGQSGSPPAASGTAPGHGGTPPGQGGTPPGHDKDK